MAESFPNEGLDLLLGIVPKGGATLATMYMGLWTTGGTNIATPAVTAVLATQTGVGEAAFPWLCSAVDRGGYVGRYFDADDLGAGRGACVFCAAGSVPWRYRFLRNGHQRILPVERADWRRGDLLQQLRRHHGDCDDGAR